tara:strand:+ start:433 stop:1155 length:723 start_codon:yes stop_codon:yes gene_type:complete
MNNNKNMLIFIDGANTAYMNSADNFRGVNHDTDDKLDVYFRAAAVGTDDNSAGYDKITLSVTDEKELDAMRGIAACVAGAKTPYVTVADDVNSVYAHDNITAVDSITLGVTGSYRGFEAITTTKSLEASDSGKVFTVDQGSAYSITLPTVAQAGAGWHATFILVGQDNNAVEIIPDASEDTLRGSLTSAAGAGVSAETGVDQLIFVANTAKNGERVDIVCTGSFFEVSGFMHDDDHITLA